MQRSCPRFDGMLRRRSVDDRILDRAPSAPPCLDLSIDRFYVNQAEAQRIEHALAEQRNDPSRRVLAIVSVGRDGRARLKGLMIDNRRLELNWL